MTAPRIRSPLGRILLTFGIFLFLANVLVFVFLLVKVPWGEAEDPDALMAMVDGALADPGVLSALLLLQAAAGILTVMFMVGSVERRPVSSILGMLGIRAVPSAGWGVVLGLVFASVVSLFISAVSGRHLRLEFFTDAAPDRIAFLLGVIAVSAFMEELMFRGYVYGIVRSEHTARRAILLTALAFATIHISSPGSSGLAWLNILLMGVVLGQLRELTGGLAVPFGLHFGWNTCLGMVFGVPVSGLNLPSILNVSLHDLSPALGGGEFGPEASAVLTVFLVILVILLARRMIPPEEDPHALS